MIESCGGTSVNTRGSEIRSLAFSICSNFASGALRLCAKQNKALCKYTRGDSMSRVWKFQVSPDIVDELRGRSGVGSKNVLCRNRDDTCICISDEQQ